MPQKLQNKNGSGLVTIPKDFLDRDGLLTEDGNPEDRVVSVERLDSGAYILRVCDERGDLPELAECDAIQRVAA
ncbi:hypothetical protein [Haloarcula pelagica]|nr:hypothetical protein [Halomicroarcula sp. YJ-61-S]